MIDSITKGNMLELASLLTTIQYHLLPEGFSSVLQDYSSQQDDQQGPILVEADDLQAAYEYQCLLDQEQELLNQRSSLENFQYSKEHLKEVLNRRIDKITTKLEDVQQSIKDTSLKARKVHCLCTRLQVWWTKESAQHYLLKSEYNAADSSTCCYSPLLGLPGSSYFSSRFPPATGGSPPVQSSQSAFHEMPSRCGCCLPFPPNKYTWEEFARILRMVALFDKDSKGKRKKRSRLPDAFQSPFTCCFRGNSNPKAVQQMYNKTFVFTPEDVLALWVRAQRSTEALRHLHMIFTVVKLLPSEQDGVNDPPKFEATLGGNPSLAKDRVCVMSRQVDALIEWSVTNQIVYSYDTIVKYLAAWHGFGVKKRRLSVSAEAKPTKRERRDTEFPNVDMFPLKVACYAFILRWFARKHRDVLSVLFSKHRNLAHLDIASSKHERRFAEVIAQVVDVGVKSYIMTNPQIADIRGYVGDLNFARVDRRLGINEKRYWEEITMPDQVEVLLEALLASRSWDDHHVAKIKAAMQDVRVMCSQFLGQSQGIYQTACNLVDIAIPPEELKGILDSMPKPYPDPPAERGEFCVCVNCEKVFKHQGRITDSQKIKFREVMKASDQLRQLCEMKYPTEVPRPDFGKDSDLTWESISISVQRNIFKDNKPQSLGLALRHTIDCAGALNKLSNDKATVADLVAIKKYEQRTNPPSLCYPMQIALNGVVIVDVAKSNTTCGMEAGFRVGDVIVGVQHLELIGDHPHTKTERVEFATASMDECTETLKIPSRKMTFDILRPSKPIVEGCKKWYKSLKALNRVLFGAMSDEDFNLHCCPDCIEKCHNTAYRGESKQEEAKKCRALIRRLGLESYAQSFMEDDVDFIQSTMNLGLKIDGLFVSLRRLDRIFSYILEEKNVADEYCMPSWACDGDEGRKLEWAAGLENTPSALLCSAVSALHHALQANSATSENTRNDFKRFVQHFLLSFSSWCIMSTPFEGRSIKTSGPSPLFLNVREPWFEDTCIHCHGRRCVAGSNTCDHMACNKPRSFKPALIRGEEFMIALNEYTECSSFVGKTILVLPSDPLVDALKSVVEIRHEDRPVEFVVVSYLPAGFGAASLQEKAKEIPFDDFDADSGFFHVLPISNPKVMDFVLSACKMRGKPPSVDADAIFSWASLEVLNLKGVSRVSLPALTRRIQDSDSIRSAINAKVAVFCSSDENERVNEACSLMRWVNTQKQVVDGTIDGYDSPAFMDKLFKLDVDNNNLESEMVREDVLQGSSIQQSQNFSNVRPTPLLEILPCKFEYPKCRLIYSDLHYSSTAERLSLEASLQNSVQTAPTTKLLPDEPRETLLLERKDPSRPGAYDGIGFGFELVRWSGEEFPRIGAVHQISPASSVGLRTHDIVLSAGGMEMSDPPVQSKLVAGLLGASTSFRVPDNQHDVIPLILSAAKSNRAILGPLVMVVQRSKVIDQHLEGAVEAPLIAANDSRVELSRRGIEAPPLHDSDTVIIESRNTGDPSLGGAPQHSASSVPVNVPEPSSYPKNSIQSPISNSQMVSSQPADDSTSSIQNSRDADAASSSPKTPMPTSASSKAADTVTVSNPKSDFGSLESQSQVLGVKEVPESRAAGQVIRTAQSTVAASDAELLTEVEGYDRQRSDPRSISATHFASESTSQIQQVPEMYRHATRNGNNNVAQMPRPGMLHPMRSSAGQYSGNSYHQLGGNEVVHHVHRQGNPPGTLNNLLRVVQSTSAHRIRAGLPHLYRSVLGEPGLILTLLETSVFLEALLNETPKLGVRLLTPRYSMTTVRSQLEILMRWTAANVQRIPRIPTAMYNYIIMLDYERSVSRRRPETGPYVLEEAGYHYREPVDILPIDRSIELALNSTKEFLGPQYQETPGPPAQNALDQYIQQMRSIPPDRIRGGGPASPVRDKKQAPESLFELSLKNIEVSRWRGLPVYAYVRLDESPSREALAVGYLHAPAPTGVSDSVLVRVQYISNIGFLEEPKTLEVYTDDVFAVDKHVKTEASAVFDVLRSLQSDLVDKHGPEGPMKFLGCLPDGRHVVWLPTDPGALLVSPKMCVTKLEYSASSYRNILTTHEEAWARERPNLKVADSGQPFPCPWGCSFAEHDNRPDSPRYALSFHTLEELRKHCKECHLFPGVPSNDVSIDCHGMPFCRIMQGDDLHEFRCDLASAIVARYPRLYCFATIEGSVRGHKTGFDKSPSGDRFCLSDSREGLRLLHKLNEKEPKSNWQGTSLLVLWDQIERIRKGVNPRVVVSGTDESSSSLFNVCRSCQKLAGTKTSGFMDCSLCSLPWETCIGWNSFGNATVHQLRRGVGCQTIGRISNMTEAVGGVFFEGRLGIAKILLLSIAESVPLAFQKKGTAGTLFSNANAFEKWKLFLKASQNPQMVQQSFVAFLASVDHNKLPRWWYKNTGGWWTSQPILSGDLAGLFSRLYACEAAFAEASIAPSA